MLGILSYTDRWVASPLDTIPVRVSCHFSAYHARFVRHERAIRSPADWRTGISDTGLLAPDARRGVVRPFVQGSCFVAEPNLELSGEPVALSIMCSASRLFDGAALCEMHFGSATACLEADHAGTLTVILRDGPATRRHHLPDLRIAQHIWSSLAMRWDPAAQTIDIAVLDSEIANVAIDFPVNAPPRHMTRLVLGGRSLGEVAAGAFDGKITGPMLMAGGQSAAAILRGNREQVLAHWDFGASDQRSCSVPDLSGRCAAGQLMNAPTRSVIGPNWTGQAQCPADQPAHYDAVKFHRDDIGDASWPADFDLTLPEDQPSGVYSVILSRDAEVDWDDRESFDCLPLFVRPRQEDVAPIALVLPTLSYRAYANSVFFDDRDPRVFALGCETGSKPIYQTANALGLRSLYDAHDDGTGCHIASLKRPQTTIRADFVSQLQGFAHQFSADLEIVEWLERHGLPYHILTDELVHEEGAALLCRYRAVLTGSHPEYVTAEILDAWQDYMQAGGALVYLGGNGFYWSVALSQDDPALLEVRRSDGSRTWAAAPGEAHQQFDGRMGGTWRGLGRPPNLLAGVGFAAVGFSGDGHYRIAKGLQTDQLPLHLGACLQKIGTAPFGVAGLELDRFEPTLGSARDLTVIASTEGLPEGYHPALEELTALDQLLPDPLDAMRARARGDIVFGRLPRGGMLFSVGSIRWTSGLNKVGDPDHCDALTLSVLTDMLWRTDGGQVTK